MSRKHRPNYGTGIASLIVALVASATLVILTAWLISKTRTLP